MFLLVPAYPGCPGQKAVKRLCVCVCVCVCVFQQYAVVAYVFLIASFFNFFNACSSVYFTFSTAAMPQRQKYNATGRLYTYLQTEGSHGGYWNNSGKEEGKTVAE